MEWLYTASGVGNAITVSFSVFDIHFDIDFVRIYSCSSFSVEPPYEYCDSETQIAILSGGFTGVNSGIPFGDPTTGTTLYWDFSSTYTHHAPDT
jgi:hypothetical protein